MPYRLAATKPMVVPVNKMVRVLVTGADVIHAFAVPGLRHQSSTPSPAG